VDAAVQHRDFLLLPVASTAVVAVVAVVAAVVVVVSAGGGAVMLVWRCLMSSCAAHSVIKDHLRIELRGEYDETFESGRVIEEPDPHVSFLLIERWSD
jgi:hypothetical protein